MLMFIIFVVVFAVIGTGIAMEPMIATFVLRRSGRSVAPPATDSNVATNSLERQNLPFEVKVRQTLVCAETVFRETRKVQVFKRALQRTSPQQEQLRKFLQTSIADSENQLSADLKVYREKMKTLSVLRAVADRTANNLHQETTAATLTRMSSPLMMANPRVDSLTIKILQRDLFAADNNWMTEEELKSAFSAAVAEFDGVDSAAQGTSLAEGPVPANGSAR